jgi:uncharacterized membrane protein YuzA (DUF378 family)
MCLLRVETPTSVRASRIQQKGGIAIREMGLDLNLRYYQKLGYKFLMVLLIAGALNWLAVGAADFNPVEKLLGPRYAKPVYIAVGIAAVFVMFTRDFYLPFLGETVMPCSLLQEHTPDKADTEVEVKAPAGAKILYWAAEPATASLEKLNDWRKAYLKYMNAGVTYANEKGVATLRVRNPQPYVVPWKGRLEPHVHFRICGDDGFLSTIRTVFLSDGHTEGFRPQ